MKTQYLTTITTRFNPFSRSSHVPRLVLAQLPASAHKTIKISTTQLPSSSTLPATLDLGFKDGKSMKFEFPERRKGVELGGEILNLKDIVEQVDRHARILRRQEELKG